MVWLAIVTVTFTAAEALERKLELPEYNAVSVYVPGANEVVETEATPAEFRVAVPSCEDPFWKITVPAGVVVPVPFTIAVNVND